MVAHAHAVCEAEEGFRHVHGYRMTVSYFIGEECQTMTGSFLAIATISLLRPMRGSSRASSLRHLGWSTALCAAWIMA